MPALTSYSPYETLVFFQNVAKYGADASALQDISITLIENPLIREGKSYDASRFSPTALQALYEKVIQAQSNSSINNVNGGIEDGNTNSRKRKLSTSPPPSTDQQRDEQSILNELVDRLYARFREEAIKEIRRSEQEYQKIRDDIVQLESQSDSLPLQAQTDSRDQSIDTAKANGVAHNNNNAQGHQQPDTSQQEQLQAQQVKPLPSSADVTPLTQPQAIASPGPGFNANKPRSATATPQTRLPSVPSLPSQSSELPYQNAVNRNTSIPPEGRPHFVPLPSQHGNSMSSQGQPMSMPNMSPMPPPSEQTALKKTHSQGRASPIQHPPQPPYPGYPGYPPAQPQWQPPIPPQPYMHPAYSNQPLYPLHQPGRPSTGYHTPNQPMYPPYPHTAPVPYPNQQQQWRGSVPAQYQNYPASASTTPIARPSRQSSLIQSASSTPWKKKSSAASTPVRGMRSPSRHEREVSPWSDRGSPTPESTTKQSSHTDLNANVSQGHRAPSITPSAKAMSRAQSVVSHTSETTSDKQGSTRKGNRIKLETPSTPLPAFDAEPAKSSARRGRPRNNTATSRPEIPKLVNAGKRKHESISSPTPSPGGNSTTIPQQAQTTGRRIPSPTDQSLVVVSKNFSRTCQLLLNAITSHKLAGIFAKPLSERDAPGYRDLVYHPADLKGIKAAVSKGSRLATATIEELESSTNDEDDDQDDSPTLKDAHASDKEPRIADPSQTEKEGSIGNGFYFVRKTEDLVPPKGIVNSAQLEMELVRMFANAVMFNPLPHSERGFGRALRIMKNGGDVVVSKTEDDDEGEVDSSDNGGSLEEEDNGTDEDGIITDAREMFEDVAVLVSRWRDLEGERMTGPPLTTTSSTSNNLESSGLRHVSVSGSTYENEDEDHHHHRGVHDGSSADATHNSTGTLRKRRRVGEH